MADSPIVRRMLKLAKENELKTGEDLLALSEVDHSDQDLINDVELGRLNWDPGVNWVEASGGLPKYIEDIAIGIMKGGKFNRSRAIAIAVSRVKRWAAGLDGVTAKTQAKASKAFAEWEALKAKNKARMAAKKAKK